MHKHYNNTNTHYGICTGPMIWPQHCGTSLSFSEAMVMVMTVRMTMMIAVMEYCSISLEVTVLEKKYPGMFECISVSQST